MQRLHLYIRYELNLLPYKIIIFLFLYILADQYNHNGT